MPKDFSKKKLIVFDLDGTLAESKAPLKEDMAKLLRALLIHKRAAVIGGGSYGQFKKQLVDELVMPSNLARNLYLFPTNSTAYYRYQGGWKKIYSHGLKKSQKERIRKAFKVTFKKVKYVPPKKIYGTVIEDRISQLSFSPLGQDIVTVLGEKKGVRLKNAWKKKNDALRKKMAEILQKLLPEFEVRVGGITTIDVTQKGLDKAYGIRQIGKVLKISKRDMLFIGDAIYPGGNDYAVVKTGVDYIKVNEPKETKKLIQFLVN